jgi:hypothetical protein
MRIYPCDIYVSIDSHKDFIEFQKKLFSMDFAWAIGSKTLQSISLPIVLIDLEIKLIYNVFDSNKQKLHTIPEALSIISRYLANLL